MIAKPTHMMLALTGLGLACGRPAPAPATLPTSASQADQGTSTSAAQATPRLTAADVDALRDPREVHLANLRQLTFGGENAEAYWSFAGDALSFQTTRPGMACDQIMTMNVAGDITPRLASTGTGRTTCAHFAAGDAEVIYASTHQLGPACPPPPDMSKGYVWALYDYEIFKAAPGSQAPVALTNSPGYDAEATVCGQDGSIIFTSTRDGDLELYRMDGDGKNVTRLTHAAGYDGGAFFSPDCRQIVWRASRPEGAALADYQALLANNLVRPTQLELWVANADGSDARQITYLGAASFAPFFHPGGQRILFSSNYPDPKGREFNLFAINKNGTGLQQITFAAGFDGFPMFSPDGKTLAFSSNRRDVVPTADGGEAYRATGEAAGPNDTNVFLAEWVDVVPLETAMPPVRHHVVDAADALANTVGALAHPTMEGRGVGTAGLAKSLDLVELHFSTLGLSPAGTQGFRQPFEVNVGMTRAPTTTLLIDGVAVAEGEFTPLLGSANGTVAGKPSRAGWGRAATDAGGPNDYAGVSVQGGIAVVHRFAPTPAAGDLASKLRAAHQAGAKAVIVIDDGDLTATEAALPALTGVRSGADAGLIAIAATRAVGKQLDAAKAIELRVTLTPQQATTHNLVARLPASRPQDRRKPALVIGAHLDHLGYGGPSSLATTREIHPGADDNASGVAVMLEVARRMATAPGVRDRDVYFVAFSAEEMGLLGSTYFVKHAGRRFFAMINMDMVGRMRANALTVLGADSAKQWPRLVGKACDAARVTCDIGGTGYGPSDHMPFYIAGVPVVHLFTGSHLDYHRPSDVVATLNFAGAAVVAQVVADLAASLVGGGTKLTLVKSKAPVPPAGGVRGISASLGTIPAYNDDPSAPPGMLVSDVVPGGAAAKAGVRAGDRVTKLDEVAIRNVEDLMAVLVAAKPGTRVRITVRRGATTLILNGIYAAPRNPGPAATR